MFYVFHNASIKKVFQNSDPKMTQALMGQNIPEDWGRSPPTIKRKEKLFQVSA
jgi:hypothetical protein